jgi:hypothetical protein
MRPLNFFCFWSGGWKFMLFCVLAWCSDERKFIKFGGYGFFSESIDKFVNAYAKHHPQHWNGKCLCKPHSYFSAGRTELQD